MDFRIQLLSLRIATFSENSGKYNGIIRVRRQSTISIFGTHFEMNTAAIGGILNIENCNVSVESSSFDQNNVREIGGAVHAFSNGSLSIAHSNFTNNLAENDGSVINLLSGSEATVVSCHFIGNGAVSNGGIVGIKESCIIIVDSIFLLSTAGSTGGIVHAISSAVEINNSTFINNSAHGNGGTIDAREGASVIIMSSILFVQNTAGVSGGVVYLDNSNVIVCNSIHFCTTGHDN